MPDKEGSEDEKTTKGVVKKKTKQMLNQEYIPEEEYDRYRDNILMRGGDHRSKETRERSNTPTGKQPKGKTVYQKQAEKKYGKGKSALDMVKADITAKYGKGAIMNVKKKSKKKANEELDLTKIAEAFGGYIVEANGKNGKKNQDSDADLKGLERIKVTKDEPVRVSDQNFKNILGILSGSKTPEDIDKAIKKRRLVGKEFQSKRGEDLERYEKIKKGLIKKGQLRQIPKNVKKGEEVMKEIERLKKQLEKTGTDDTVDVGGAKVSEKDLRDVGKTKNPGEFANVEGETEPKKLKPKPKKPRTIPFKDKTQLDPETQKKIDAVTPPFATKQGETGTLPVSMRNRRVPKTSSLSPNVKVTSIVKPTVGSLARTDQETSAITKGGIDYKALQDKIKTVSLGKGMEVVDEPKTRTQGGRIGQDTGRTVDTTATEVKPDQLTGSKPRQRNLLEPPKGVDPYELLKLKNFKTTKTEPEPQPEPEAEKERRSETIRSNPTDRSGNKPPRKPPRVTTGRGGKGRPFKDFATSLVKLSKDNPALSLIGYDQLKNMQNPFAIRGGRSGMASARGGGGL